MEYELIEVERDGHVVTVTLDNPPVNATNQQMLLETIDLFEQLGDDKEVRVAIFTAAGTRAFIGGADLKKIAQEVPPAPAITDPGVLARRAMWAIYDCAVPVICAVNGPALGGGLAFAAVCDIIISVEGASFATPEINVGLLGASSHLSLLVGRYKARELFFTGDRISAEELHRLGAIREVVPREELLPAARRLAQQLAAKSPIALRLAKESMNRSEFLPLKEGYRIEQDYTNRLLRFEDSAEARRAFFEKREPAWKWR